MISPDTPVSKNVCSVDGCARPLDARGWCRMHWKRWRKHGDPRSGQPQRIVGDDLARLMSHVRVDPSGCWIWSGSLNGRGYGQMYWRGRVRRAHRVSYALLKGPLVEGLDLDHLCRVTLCVNPAHLEQVTHLVNVRRGWRARGLSPSGLGVIGSIL